MTSDRQLSNTARKNTDQDDLFTYPQHSLVSVPDVTTEPKPLFCRLQGLGVTADPTPDRRLRETLTRSSAEPRFCVSSASRSSNTACEAWTYDVGPST